MTVQKAVLPALMAEGMLSEDFITCFDLELIHERRDGTFVVPPDFAKTARRQRPHIFKPRRKAYVNPDLLRDVVFNPKAL